MSQVSMNPAERMAALARFGYTESEAKFLDLAALHGGYFLRRQYGQFLGRQDGGTLTQLIQKAMARNHLRTSALRQRTQLYHLCARPFYGAIGQEDNRNRRQRQLPTIANKIMGLDFVLAHREGQYLATEQEKLEYFGVDLKIDPSVLPAKVYQAKKSGLTTHRFFMDKYPILLAPSANGTAPVVWFCFVDEGLVGLSHFENYLAQYKGLFASLPEFRLVYVAAKDTHFAAARSRFECLVMGSNGACPGANIDHVFEYFEARRAYEAKQFAGFDRAKLLRLRDAREEFAGKENEALYERWKADGEEAVRQILAPTPRSEAQVHGTFSTSLLEHDYECFGYLSGW